MEYTNLQGVPDRRSLAASGIYCDSGALFSGTSTVSLELRTLRKLHAHTRGLHITRDVKQRKDAIYTS